MQCPVLKSGGMMVSGPRFGFQEVALSARLSPRRGDSLLWGEGCKTFLVSQVQVRVSKALR